MTTEPSRPVPATLHCRLFPAVAIIAIGVLFLAHNLGYSLKLFEYGIWWAVFILLAAFAPLTRAFEVYHARGRVDAEVAYFLLSAAGIVLVAGMFLLGLDWGTWWPLFVILGGLYTLMPYRRRHCYRHGCRADSDATIQR
jgi:hypothetical protein